MGLRVLAKLAPWAILLVILLGACHDDVPSASPQQESAEPPPQSEIQVVVRTPQDPEADALQPEHREQSSTVQDSEPQSVEADSPARPAPEPEARGGLTETAVDLYVPHWIDSVELHAWPNVDWPTVAILLPGQRASILGLAPLTPRGNEIGWLLVQTSDGTRGWVTAKSLRLRVSDLKGLPRLDRADAVAHATTKQGAVIHSEPRGDNHCVLPEGIEVEVAGRSPDGKWLYARPGDQGCRVSNRYQLWEGWIPVGDLEYDPLLDRAPVIHSYGLWLVSTDPGMRSHLLSDSIRDSWGSEPWDFDANDQSIVFVHYEESGAAKLKRYTTEAKDIAALPHGGGDILVAPSGGRVLVMNTRRTETSGFGTEPSLTLTIVEPDGRTTEIGEAFLYCQCGRGRLLSRQARWSPDGRTVVFRDWGIPRHAVADHDAGAFWLYRTDINQRVDLLAEESQWLPIFDTAEFHPDSKSLYVRVSVPGQPGDYRVRRLTLDGEGWPDFSSIPADTGLRVSPDGQLLIAMTDDVLLILTDQGELHSARSGYNARWLPDSERFFYYKDGRTVIGEVGTEGPIEEVASEPRDLLRYRSTPDGEYLTVEDGRHDWPVGNEEIRIYASDGRLRTTFRYTGCSEWRWSPDGSRLVVSVHNLCVGE
ncbi:MAG: hypothetical protein F4Z51_07800 [Chloroflexi bacterium]|nr:hypothetical protein [Chloroflexota bacterium]